MINHLREAFKFYYTNCIANFTWLSQAKKKKEIIIINQEKKRKGRRIQCVALQRSIPRVGLKQGEDGTCVGP